MNKRVVGTVAGMCVVALIFFLTGSFMREATTERASEPYAGGELIDARAPMPYEEDGEIAELGRRLVALASGEKFTDGQVEQLSELVASLFLGVRENSMGVDEHEWRLDKLEEVGR